MEEQVDFNSLWLSRNNAVLAKRKQVQSFAFNHSGMDGIPKIFVNGELRKICWKSIGAGLYRVSTEAIQ